MDAIKVLMVDDEERMRKLVKDFLTIKGYRVLEAGDGEEAIDIFFKEKDISLVILDVMMPKMDGFEATRQMRRAGVSTPILLLTARDAVGDKITGLDAGADDYMTKPFSPAELMAHLRALSRRQGEVQFESLQVGDLTLGLESYELTCGSKSINLSFKEFSICKILMSSPNTIVSKDTLIQKAWGVTSSAGDNNVEAYISFLRKKLKHLGSTCKIETVRRAGYRFVG